MIFCIKVIIILLFPFPFSGKPHNLNNTHFLFISSRAKSFSRRTTQELWSSLWNGSTQCTSSHQSHGDYFDGETPWVLVDRIDQVFPALKLAFLYVSPHSCCCPFPPVHRTLGLPALAARHRVVASRDHLLPRQVYSSFKRLSRAHLTKLINEPGFFEVFSKSFPAESSRVPREAPSFAAPTLIHCLAPLF